MLVRAEAAGVRRADAARRCGSCRSSCWSLVIAGAIINERENIADYFADAGLVALLFNLISLASATSLPRLAKVGQAGVGRRRDGDRHPQRHAGHRDRHARLLDNTQMAIPAAVYSIIMFFTAAAFGYLVRPGTA